MATPRKTAVKKPAPVNDDFELEMDEVEAEDLELDEVEEEEVVEPPKRRGRPAKATKETSKKATEEVVFGIADLARHLTELKGEVVTTRELRSLARKLARDGSGRVDREIIPGNRARYNWSGIDHPEVQALISAFEGGELEEDKQAKLQALKDRKAAERAETKAQSEADEAEDLAPAPRRGRPAKSAPAKAKPAPVIEEDEDDEDIEL